MTHNNIFGKVFLATHVPVCCHDVLVVPNEKSGKKGIGVKYP